MSHKFQLNGKHQPSGVISTLGGDTYSEFYQSLLDVGFAVSEADEIMDLYKSTLYPLSGGSIDQATANVVQVFPQATPVAAPAGAPTCQHGPREYRAANAQYGKAAKWICPLLPIKTPDGKFNQARCQPVNA